MFKPERFHKYTSVLFSFKHVFLTGLNLLKACLNL